MSAIQKTLVVLGLVLALAGCDDEQIQVGRGAPTATGAPATGPGQAIADVDAGAELGPQIPSYRDEDFVEADTNRDPFRSYASMFTARGPERIPGERNVIMEDTGIDEMRVIAIVSGVPSPRAMLIDDEGVGHTVRRGEYIGRSEVVQAGGTEELPVTLNWRVDRIRPGEVVLTRDDPTAPNRPPLTRVLPLRDENEELALPGVRTVDSDALER